jgi:hypothetical protein
MAQSEELDGWTIKAGKVRIETPRRGNHAEYISGVFTLRNVSSDSVTRRAGACLLADLTDQNVGKKTCSTDSECIPVDHYLVSPAGADPDELLFGGKGHAYCRRPEGSEEPKRCWTRPGSQADYCMMGELEDGRHTVPLPVNRTNTTAKANPLGSDQSIRWMVLACLNPEVTGPKPPCADATATNKVYSSGPAKLVKP